MNNSKCELASNAQMQMYWMITPVIKPCGFLVWWTVILVYAGGIAITARERYAYLTAVQTKKNESNLISYQVTSLNEV